MATPLKRQSVLSPSEVRRNDAGPAPIPEGARVGNVIASSLMSGRGEKGMPRDPDEQAMSMFANLKSFMERAGGTTENIVQLTVYLQDEQYRPSINKAWLDTFPDPNSRPGRIVVYRDFGLERAARPPEPDRPQLFFEISVIAVV
jgi:enamine deaminase RidA (YjgF/YER057c/UK114 family)